MSDDLNATIEIPIGLARRLTNGPHSTHRQFEDRSKLHTIIDQQTGSEAPTTDCPADTGRDPGDKGARPDGLSACPGCGHSVWVHGLGGCGQIQHPNASCECAMSPDDIADASKPTDPDLVLCGNCGLPEGSHHLVNYSDGPHAGRPELVCIQSCFVAHSKERSIGDCACRQDPCVCADLAMSVPKIDDGEPRQATEGTKKRVLIDWEVENLCGRWLLWTRERLYDFDHNQVSRLVLDVKAAMDDSESSESLVVDRDLIQKCETWMAWTKDFLTSEPRELIAEALNQLDAILDDRESPEEAP